MNNELNNAYINIMAYIYHKTENLNPLVQKEYRDSLCSYLGRYKDVTFLSDTEKRAHQYMAFGCKWIENGSKVDIPYNICITRLNRFLPHMIKDKAIIKDGVAYFRGQKVHINYYDSDNRKSSYSSEEYPIILSNIGTFFTCLDGNHRISLEIDAGNSSVDIYYCVPSITKRCVDTLYNTILYACVIDVNLYEAKMKNAVRNKKGIEETAKEWLCEVTKQNSEIIDSLTKSTSKS